MARKIRNEILAILLIFVLFIHAIPNSVLTALAESIGDALTSEATVEQEYYPGNMVDTGNVGEGEIVSEIVENRTETTKEYLLSDGMIMVQQFIEAVHYYDNGEYKEIDNTLEEKEGEYSNKANSFKVKFNKGQEKKHIVEIQEDEYSLTLGYNEKGNKTKKVKVKNEKAENKENNGDKKNTRPNKLKGTKGQITFENISDDINFSYEIKNNKLKNNIVIDEEKDDYTIIFELQSSNLTLEQNDDKSISAYNVAGKEKFNIPMPSMIDADGKESTALTFELKEEEGKIKIIITPDKNYINEEAELPVTITPEIHSVKDKNFSFNNVYENGKKVTCGEQVIIGKMSGEEKSDVFMNFTLPEVSPYYELVGASVNIGYDTDGMGLLDSKDLSYNVSVVESTEDLESITFDNKPAKMQTLNGITRESQRSTQTDIYESKIINPNAIENNVMTLAIETTEETSENAYSRMSIAEMGAYLIIWMTPIIGIQDYYSMESTAINGATTYVNHANGHLTTTIDLVSINTLSSMPFAVSLVYNDYYNTLITPSDINSYVGKNFKLNFEQYVVAYGDGYKYMDADGSVTMLKLRSGTKYYSKDKGLTYDSITQRLYDDLGNMMWFSGGKLVRITSGDNATEFITITYDESVTDKIKEITYTNNTTNKAHKILLSYSNNKLDTITTKVNNLDVGTRKSIEYNENGYLTSIIDKTNKYLDGATGQDVSTIIIGYMQNASSSNVDLINYIYNNQDEGIIFNRTSSDKVYEIRTMAGENPSALNSCLTKVRLDYFGIYTKISYSINNVDFETNHISFNNIKKVISQWKQTADGYVSVQTTTNWKNTDDIVGNYTEEACGYLHPSRDEQKYTLASTATRSYVLWGDDIDIFANGVANIEDKDNYRYAVLFKVNVSDSEAQIAEELNVTAKIVAKSGEKSLEENIVLSQGGHTYVCIPCEYYEEVATLSITNNGTIDIFVSGAYYGAIDSVVTTNKAYNGAHKTDKVETYSRFMDYSLKQYDTSQRIKKEITRYNNAYDIEYTTNYNYSTSSLYPLKNKLISVSQYENDALITNTVYEYSFENNTCTEVITTTMQDEQTTRTSLSIKITSDGGEATQIIEDGSKTTLIYSVTNGDVRQTETRYANSKKICDCETVCTHKNYTCERYTYNNLGQVTQTKIYETTDSTYNNITESNLIFEQNNEYNVNGRQTRTTYGEYDISYTFNNYGLISSINRKVKNSQGQLEDKSMLSYTYNATMSSNFGYGDNAINSKTYANGWSENYAYTDNRSTNNGLQTVTSYSNGSQVVHRNVYKYNDKGIMTRQEVQNYTQGTMQTELTYDYDNVSDRTKQSISIRGMQFSVDYTNNYNESNGQLMSSYLKVIDGCAVTTNDTVNYSYDSKGQLTNMIYDSNKISYGYNSFGQLTGRKIYPNNETNSMLNETYTYGVKNDYQTGQLTAIENNFGDERTSTYDENGYLTELYYNLTPYYYTYDSLGRLVSEKIGNRTTNYSYDDNNNILRGDDLVYSNGMLTSVNGQQIIYDALGNPTTYKDNTFTWVKGRYLSRIQTEEEDDITYSYDGNGMRYKKVVNGQTTKYFYNGSQLLLEARTNGAKLYYYYGLTGIEGMYYQHANDSKQGYYYFEKNTLGDIVAIRNEEGKLVATYEYNAWGETTVNGYMGNINPFRYRGYYYDVETGFYYLQTRYYDPTIMRFINADNYELVPSLTSGELNLYSYCANNPMMLTDPTGELIGWLAVMLFTPVGGIVLQTSMSVGCYIGFAVASLFDENIRNDMNNIAWNPFNSNAQAVINSKKVSFYKGVPIVKADIERSFSIGVIHLKKIEDEIDELNHERGHNTQLMMMGIFNYAVTVGIPSVLKLGGYDAKGQYNSAPWETMAQILGGVEGHPEEEIKRAWDYYTISMINIPLATLYWLG